MISIIKRLVKRYRDWRLWCVFTNYSTLAKLGALLNLKTFPAIHFAVFQQTLED